MSLIVITPRIALDEKELEERFVRASGPGGQNVNKVATAVQLRFDVRRSPSLPDDVRARLVRLAGQRLTTEGVVIITAQEHRTQERNRDEARRRLFELLRAASVPPRPRHPTRPSLGSKTRRLETKAKRGRTKALRRAPVKD